MLQYGELQQNPISVTLSDQSGATFTVRVERLRRGLVKIACECPRQLAAGWCEHCLAVFSDREIFEDSRQRRAFEHIVSGTYLESVANKLTKALDAFATAYRQMKFDRPVDLDPSQLNSFAKHAYQAGENAGHLAHALENFIEELRRQPSPVLAYPDDPGHAQRPNLPNQLTVSELSETSESSGDIDRALEIVRQALEKELVDIPAHVGSG